MNSHGHRFLIGLSFFLYGTQAHAYIDPGTGSALIQGLIAAVAAIGVTLKLYWHRIMRFFGLGESEDIDDQ